MKARRLNGYHSEQSMNNKTYCFRVVDGFEVSHILTKHPLVGRLLLMIGAIFQ